MSTALRAILVVGVFAVLGPPVGGAVAWLMMGARSLRSPLPFITGAYGEAIWLAIGTGLICGAALLLRRVSWLVPICAALAVSSVAIVIGLVIDPPRGDVLAALARVAVVFVPPAIVAALVCWLIARRFLRHDT
jgi:hypothetical protein